MVPVLPSPDPSLGPGRQEAAARDSQDPLAGFIQRFLPVPDGVVYLDGNSLGRLPASTPAALDRVMREEWGQRLIRSWEHWVDLPFQVGDELAELLGAGPGEVVVADSTSVNLYRLAMAAVSFQPGRRCVVVEADNFPSDRYVLEGITQQLGLELRVLPCHMDNGWTLADLASALDPSVALVCLSHVSYRSAAVADMRGATRLIHQAGALCLWDLSHSVGALPLALEEDEVDLAVGCTYKYLNGGPGSPAFLYVRRARQAQLRQPIWGWFGRQDHFAMADTFEARPGIGGFQVGTPPILGVTAVREGARLVREAGIAAIRAKGLALTEFAMNIFDAQLAPLGFSWASPRLATARGHHVSLHHPRAQAILQKAASSGLLADFRTPERIRLGLSPLSTRYVDVFDAMSILGQVATAR